jgi:hypothetical protein
MALIAVRRLTAMTWPSRLAVAVPCRTDASVLRRVAVKEISREEG